MSINCHPQAYEALQARSAELMAEAELERAIMALQAGRPSLIVRAAALLGRMLTRAGAASPAAPRVERAEAEPAPR